MNIVIVKTRYERKGEASISPFKPNKNLKIMETFTMPPMMSKAIIRKTGEEVEVIAYNQPCSGKRTEPKDLTFEEGDWVTYIDSNGKEHIREKLNMQLDFKPIINDTWSNVFSFAKDTKMPTTRNCRIFELAKELLVNGHKGLGTSYIDEIVEIATELVDKVGIETT